MQIQAVPLTPDFDVVVSEVSEANIGADFTKMHNMLGVYIVPISAHELVCQGE